ncbi:MAG: hypothetical protein Q4D62_07370 [Planctomycetia bacterium]|nr:hypothetical protein [Planctomycetia bacterium]
MKHPFFQWLRRFQRASRRLATEFALEVIFLYVGLGFLVVGGVDYSLYRFWAWESSTWRTAALAGLAVGGIWFLFRLVPILRWMPRTEQETLQRLQELPVGERLPQSAGSALAFLREGQKTGVSEELRQAVIAEATEKLAQIPISEALSGMALYQNRWHFRRWTLILFLALLGLVHFHPQNITIGAQRLTQPWRNVPWHLEIPLAWKEIPENLVEGEDFLAELQCRGHFPQLRMAVWDTEKEPRIYDLKPIHNRYRVRLPAVRHSFRIAAFWQGQPMENETLRTISVHPRPTLREAQIHIVPPRYTGQKPYAGHWDVAGLPKTRIGILITSRQPLQSARILFSDGTFLPGRCYEDDPCRYLFVWEILRNIAYRLELTDKAGISNQLETWQCVLRNDLPPHAILKEPAPHRSILPGATLSVNVVGEDDYGMAALGFRWLAETAHSQPETRSPRWTPFQLWNLPEAPATTPPHVQEASFQWDLGSLKLTPGSRVRLEPFGEDAALETVFGEEVTLSVVTPEEMSQRVFRQWMGLTQEMRRLYQILLQTEGAAQNSLTEAQTASENLFRRMDRKYPDSFWPILDVLARDLRDNPPFPMTHDLSSEDQEKNLENLLQILTHLEQSQLPALKQAFYHAQQAVEKATDEEKERTEASFRTRIQALLAEMIPPLKQWLESGESAQSRIDLWEQLEKTATLLDTLRQETTQTLPHWIGRQPDQWNSQTRETYETLFQQQEMLAVQTKHFFEEYSRLYPRQNVERYSSALHFLIREMILLHRERLFGRELACQQEIREVWQMFRRHLTSQETWSPTLVALVEELARIQSQQLPIVQEWETFGEETVPSRTHRLRQLRHAQKQREMQESLEAIPPSYPVSVQILLAEIGRQLEQSANQFVLLASEKLTHPALLQNQRLLQEEILRSLERLKTELEKNPSDVPLAESDESVENKVENASEKNTGETLSITAMDIQLLAALQEENRTETLSWAQNPRVTAAAIALLEKRQKQILQIAEALGFETHTQSSSSNILAQMNQVHYLFTQKEISTLNTTIQREIVYQLNQMLRADSQEEPSGTESGNTSAGEEKDLSISQDSTDTSATLSAETAPTDEKLASPSQTFRKKIWGELPQRLQKAWEPLPENTIWPEYEEKIQAYYRFLEE